MKIHQLEQRSPEWLAIRLGKPTASEFSRIVTSTGEPSKSRPGYAIQLAAELYAKAPLNSWGGNVSLDRGTFLEDDALKAYEFLRDVVIDRVGFVTDDDEIYGCSPDGLIGEDGMVELKCIGAEKHVAALLRHKAKGDVPPDYVQQTQGQMWITGRKWCDLIFYHPVLPMLVVRQTPSAQVVSGLFEGIIEVLDQRDEVLEALIEMRDGKVERAA